MDFSVAFLSAQQLLLVAFVLGVVTILKNANLSGKDNRWAPAESLVTGLAIVWLIPSATWQLTILAGLSVGFLGSGIFSSAKTTFQASTPADSTTIQA